MTDCCLTQRRVKPKTMQFICPLCGERCLPVSLKAMLQHVAQPWAYPFADAQYYYCHRADCDAVYIAADDEVIRQSQLRSHAPNAALICFCFGVTKSAALADKEIKSFVIAQTKRSMCACDSANPSGRCCLKDFPKFN